MPPIKGWDVNRQTIKYTEDIYCILYGCFLKNWSAKRMKIYNTSQNNLIAGAAKTANNFVSRSIGLILRVDIKNDEALIIKPCNSIHTFFMKFDIDVIFVSKKNKVIAIYEKVKPFRILPIHLNSHYVIELKAGVAKAKNIQKNDVISFVE